MAESLLGEKLPSDALSYGMRGWRTTATVYSSVAYQSTITNKWQKKKV